MDTETLYLQLLADINDALKSEAPPLDKLAMVRQAKYRAEQRYAALHANAFELIEQEVSQ